MTVRRGLVGGLPPWARSLRFRMALLYSSVLFSLAALIVGAVYLGLSLSLRGEPLSKQTAVIEVVAGNGRIQEGRTFIDSRAFEQKVNKHALENLRTYSFGALGTLFVASLAVGWVIAGRALRPIDGITAVAREIQATNLSRRIDLQGPDDELKRLADTFDDMLSRLDEAFASQRQFVADASHELRNPLAIVQTNADLTLADPEASAEISRRAGRTRRASERMSRLVEDLLALARLDAPLARRETIDLGELAAEVGDEFLPQARARGLRLEWGSRERAVLVGDRPALKRAVANLVDNAVRYASAGTSVRLVSGRRNGWAWVAVSDEGPGIGAEHQRQLFDRFYRVDKARARADGGSGLGLAIAREIAEAHDGDVRLFSEVGRGSTFVLRLALTDARGDAWEPSPL
jgi:signal transduction histidine kinase